MPIYTEEVKDTNLHKTAVGLETSQILNSSKVNDAITNNISGYKWKVNFYNQILSKMDAPKQLDTAVNITIQPYRLIEDVEMILTSPITSASTTNLNGDAYIDIRSAVFKYDMFIAEVVGSHVNEDLLDEKGKIHFENANMMAYCHGEYFPLSKKPIMCYYMSCLLLFYFKEFITICASSNALPR